MKNDPKKILRYTPSERANHWLTAVTFILLALSGLSFFHPVFYPLTQLFGGGTWTRILHPFFGVLMAVSFGIDVFQLPAAECHDADRLGMAAPCPRDGEWR